MKSDFLLSRMSDLDRMAYNRGILKHSGFLTLSEQARALSVRKDFLTPGVFLSGGHEDADRNMVIFPGEYQDEKSSEEECIGCVKAVPLNLRYADDLTHRDVLGALMNLGIERTCIGDILTDGKTVYIFCEKEMTDFIMENLTKIRHTEMECSSAGIGECVMEPKLEDRRISIPSERADAVIASVFKISRSLAAELISSELVFAGGKVLKSNSSVIRENDRVSVRGYGKFIYMGVEGESRKGRLFVKIRMFV